MREHFNTTTCYLTLLPPTLPALNLYFLHSVQHTIMSRRTNEGPMDFEYQNGTGPVDAQSPFTAWSNNSRMSELAANRAAFKSEHTYKLDGLF